MCVIVISKTGKKLPEEILKKCWDKNDDGAGIAVINDDKSTFVSKGYKTYEDFLKGYNSIPSNRHVIHFRLVSKGDDNNAMTHPFVLEANLYKAYNVKNSYNLCFAGDKQNNELIEFNTNEYALFHNGTVSAFGDEDNSDTFYLAYMLSHIEDAGKFAVLQNLSDVNKFCMVGKGNILYWGEFIKEETAGEDFLFSNNKWKDIYTPSLYNINVYNNGNYWWDKEKNTREQSDIKTELLLGEYEEIGDDIEEPIKSLCDNYKYRINNEIFCFDCPHENKCGDCKSFNDNDNIY